MQANIQKKEDKQQALTTEIGSKQEEKNRRNPDLKKLEGQIQSKSSEFSQLEHDDHELRAQNV